jgi:hypothetical protein
MFVVEWDNWGQFGRDGARSSGGESPEEGKPWAKAGKSVLFRNVNHPVTLVHLM